MFKLDRAFRSVKHMHDTFHTWEMLGIAFKSQREQFDNSTPVGRLMLNMLAALAVSCSRDDMLNIKAVLYSQ